MKKKILILLINFTFISFVFSQDFKFEWVKSYNGASVGYDRTMAVDLDGNTYITGIFTGTIDFNQGAGIYSLSSNGSNDIYIAKFDSSNTFVWAKSVGGPGNDNSNSICLDSYGNIIVIGDYSDTADFDPGTGITNLISSGQDDSYILKLDNSGNLIWVKSFGNSYSDHISSVDIDNLDNIYCTGYFIDSVDFNPDSAIYYLNSYGGFDVYNLKLNGAGKLIWANHVGGNATDLSYSLVVDNGGNVYTTGNYIGITDFDPGPNTLILSYASYYPNIFISKLDSSGNLIWAKSFTYFSGGIPLTYDGLCAYSIAIDNNSNVYTTGFMQSSADFDPGPNEYVLTTNGSYDIFIAKLDNAGNFAWAKNIGGELLSTLYPDVGYSLAVDENGNIYTTGCFEEIVDFDPGPGIYNLSCMSSKDVFILKLDSIGNFVDAINFGGQGDNVGFSILSDMNGSIYASGTFSSNVDFNLGIGEAIINGGISNGYFVKYSFCSTINISITETTCVEYNFNGNILTNSGIYIDTLLSYYGCDSIVELDLTIITVDTSVTQTGNILLASANATSYQWIDCANGNSIIAGATNQAFTASANGVYAVIVSENGCSDTSSCYTVSLGISNFQLNRGISITPNPVNTIMSINTDNKQIQEITIYKQTGQMLKTMHALSLTENSYNIDISELPVGSYFIRVLGKDNVWAEKFVVIR